MPVSASSAGKNWRKSGTTRSSFYLHSWLSASSWAPGEITEASWSEFDFNTSFWILPARRARQVDRDHTVHIAVVTSNLMLYADAFAFRFFEMVIAFDLLDPVG